MTAPDYDRDLPDPADDRVQADCPRCGGSGEDPDAHPYEIDCGECGGVGWVWVDEVTPLE